MRASKPPPTSALMRRPARGSSALYTAQIRQDGRGVRLLLVDNEDCFIHTLANYARQTGAEVITYRTGFPLDMIQHWQPSLILISPGPGRPEDFGVPALVRHAAKLEVPVFGVCLGLQGMVEAFGGGLGVLGYPKHGKPAVVQNRGVGVFEGLPKEFTVGRYHSLYALPEKLPSCFEVTAECEDPGFRKCKAGCRVRVRRQTVRTRRPDESRAETLSTQSEGLSYANLFGRQGVKAQVFQRVVLQVIGDDGELVVNGHGCDGNVSGRQGDTFLAWSRLSRPARYRRKLPSR